MLEISQCKSMTQVLLCLLPWAMSLVKKFAKMENCVGNHTWLVHQTSPTWLTGANPLLWIWVTFIHYAARIIINNCPVTWGKIKSKNYSKQCVFYGKVYKISAQVLTGKKMWDQPYFWDQHKSVLLTFFTQPPASHKIVKLNCFGPNFNLQAAIIFFSFKSF